MSAFVIQSGKYRGKRLRLNEPELVVGRDESCRIRLSSEEVSRFHCVIRKTDAGWTVRDLGSSNGTYVNQAAVDDEYRLQGGDLLSVGPMTLQFIDASNPPRPATKGPAISEDDIAGLLSDEFPVPTGDTAIITPEQLRPPTKPAEVEEPAAEPEPEPDRGSSLEIDIRPLRQFDSVAEEAADIIRRHRESLESEAAG